MWTLSQEEERKLLQLKERLIDLKDYWANGPFELVRFVLEHSCHGNVDTMEHRVRRCVHWRLQHQVDVILETFAPTILAYQFPAAIMKGLDRDGGGVVVIRQGDPLGLLHRFGIDEVLRSLFWGLEFAIRGPWQQQLSQRPKMVTAIIDLKGLNHRHYHPSLIAIVQRMGFALQLHYPHIAKKVLVVNAPGIFRIVWSILKPFVMPHLRMLMEVASEAETEELLNKYVDLSVLPDVLAPGKGRGKPVRGLNPNRDMLFLPPKQSDDWNRIPLVYGTDENECIPEEPTAVSLTGSMSSSLASEGLLLKANNRHQLRTSVRPLCKGMWLENMTTHTITITA